MRKPLSHACLLLFVILTATYTVRAQVNTGALHFQVTDPAGLGLRSSVELTSLSNRYHAEFATDLTGRAEAIRLPYGIYVVTVKHAGFAKVARTVEVRTAVPVEYMVQLQLESINTVVDVDPGVFTLVDPNQPSSAMQIGTAEIRERVSSLPGRSLQDLVVSQPGWIYEGNAVLHPRGSEYQTQFVVDGIPLTDNRSPSFGPEIEADDLDSVSIYTAGIPAEYGRKMGGIVELNTARDPAAGVHGTLVLSGGSYQTAQGYAHIGDTWGGNSLSGTASGSMTSHFLNPVVPENFTNRGTTGDFSVRYERDLGAEDRLSLNVRHELARFEIPNELLQQSAGQLQTGDNFETVGTVRYAHTFSANGLGTLAGMVRDNANDLFSNEDSTPVIATQHNNFREGYFKAAFSLHHGRHEFKAGLESDNVLLHENFSYVITDPTQFDDNTPPSLRFLASRPDLEQSAFAEDLIRLGRWTISAGLRWDHYQLLLNQNAFSPRVSIGRSIPSLNLVLHAAYDRVFQTPSFENILISSSTAIDALNDQFLRLPVRPSLANYYEGGVTEGFSSRLRLGMNVYRRDIRDFADDDQLLNTGVSYPISFRKAVVYGGEAKLELVRLGHLTGFASYSYMVANAWFPVTGGLFLGDDAGAAIAEASGHFPASQDQRNSLSTRFRYAVGRRMWLAAGAGYGSGLPFAYGGTEADALAQYGPGVISRINFDRGRIRPRLAVNASLGADLYKGDRFHTRFQVDGTNLNNRLDVIDFGGLFSGNAIGPARSFGLRLDTRF